MKTIAAAEIRGVDRKCNRTGWRRCAADAREFSLRIDGYFNLHVLAGEKLAQSRGHTRAAAAQCVDSRLICGISAIVADVVVRAAKTDRVSADRVAEVLIELQNILRTAECTPVARSKRIIARE